MGLLKNASVEKTSAIRNEVLSFAGEWIQLELVIEWIKSAPERLLHVFLICGPWTL